ncbi:MAG: hypothetical protein L0170_13190, partial [Acidobacteria bacterium]|nr:hypothetical protein [Acidobacteriota bacterium]
MNFLAPSRTAILLMIALFTSLSAQDSEDKAREGGKSGRGAAQGGMILLDTFSGKNLDKLEGRTPDTVNALGCKWTEVGIRQFRAYIASPAAEDLYHEPMAGLSSGQYGTGAIAVPIMTQGSWVKPKKFTISAEFLGWHGQPRPALGFYSALPDKTREEPAEKNFTGLLLRAGSFGGDNGTLVLYEDGKEGKAVKYTGVFDQNRLHRLSYDVDVTSGALSNVSLSGSTSDYSSFNTSAFTDAATAFAAVGYVARPGFGDRTFVHNFVIGSEIALPALPPPVPQTWIPKNPGLLACFRASDYNPDSGVWKDCSGNGNDAKSGAHTERPKGNPARTPNGSSTVTLSKRLGGTMHIKPVDLSGAFTVLAFMIPGPQD